MQDLDIIALFQQRSEDAVEELSKKYGKLLYKISNNVLNNHQDVEECVNDAYFAIWEQIPPKTPDPFCAYLCGLVRNVALKKYLSDRAEKRSSNFSIALDDLEKALISYDTPEKSVELQESIASINQFLGKLKAENRHIFLLRYWQGESVGSIAKALNLSENVVSARLSRMKKKLKKDFEQEV